jgi:hypothetical protein
VAESLHSCSMLLCFFRHFRQIAEARTAFQHAGKIEEVAHVEKERFRMRQIFGGVRDFGGLSGVLRVHLLNPNLGPDSEGERLNATVLGFLRQVQGLIATPRGLFEIAMHEEGLCVIRESTRQNTCVVKLAREEFSLFMELEGLGNVSDPVVCLSEIRDDHGVQCLVPDGTCELSGREKERHGGIGIAFFEVHSGKSVH